MRPLHGDDQRAVGVVITLIDVTDRRDAEQALRRSEQRFRALVNASSYVVYRMSPDWGEMKELDGQGFIVDTSNPNRDWLDQYIHPGGAASDITARHAPPSDSTQEPS